MLEENRGHGPVRNCRLMLGVVVRAGVYTIHDGRLIEARRSSLIEESLDPRHGGPLIDRWQIELIIRPVSVLRIPSRTGNVFGPPRVSIEHEAKDSLELAMYRVLAIRGLTDSMPCLRKEERA